MLLSYHYWADATHDGDEQTIGEHAARRCLQAQTTVFRGWYGLPVHVSPRLLNKLLDLSFVWTAAVAAVGMNVVNVKTKFLCGHWIASSSILRGYNAL
jgi:hypothetical protein